ncbi:MAG: bacterial Ig-like domain-containing protein, partial [Bacilli bacterium]
MRKFKKLSTLALGFALAIGVGAGIGANRLEGAKAAENVSFTLDLTNLGGSAVLGLTNYDGGAERTATVNTIGIGSKDVTSSGANLQFKKTTGVLYNTTALPGRLVSVVLTQTGTAREHSLYGGSTSRLVNDVTADYTVSGTLVSTQTVLTTTWTISAGTDYTYFCISRGGNASTVSSIVVTYASASVEFGVLDHILLDHSSVKKTYFVGETFDAEGLIVTAVDEDDNEMEVIDWTTDYDGHTFVTSDIGTKQVTVAYTDTENDITAYGNFNITIGEYVPGEGVISFGVANSEYKTSWTSADLSITKSVPEIGDLQFSEINNVRLNASPRVGSISIGGNSTTGGEFTITLPALTYASAIKFNGLSVGSDATTPTLKINDKTSFTFASGMTSATLKPYDNVLVIS